MRGALAAAFLAACTTRPAPASVRPPQPSATTPLPPKGGASGWGAPSAEAHVEEPTALTGPDTAELEIADGNPAVVSLPIGARDKRPVAVATHGAGGRAEPHCRYWRALLGPRPFIVCPRGRRTLSIDPGTEPGFYYPGHPQLGREVEAVLAALAAKWGPWVDLDAPLYAGYSQGAGMGAMILPTHSGKFARAVLVEGGFGQFQEWNIAAAQRFRENGGKRVLFACGRPVCFELAKECAHWLELGGVEARVVYGAGAGHTNAGTVEEELRGALAWLLGGDPRW